MSCPISALLNPDDTPQQNEQLSGGYNAEATASESLPQIVEGEVPRDENIPSLLPVLSTRFHQPRSFLLGQQNLSPLRQHWENPSVEDDPDEAEVDAMQVDLTGSRASISSSQAVSPQASSFPHSKSEPNTKGCVNKGFNIFQALVGEGMLIFEVARQLEVDDLISLYAISRDFHNRLDAHFTPMILSQSLAKAPESSRCFLFKAYKPMCQPDPAGRPNPNPEKAGEVRMVPTFRWLRMVIFREKVVKEIIALLAQHGHRVPPSMSVTLKKIWLTMDVPSNVGRVGLIHSRKFWTNADLFNAMLFFIKVDMRCTDPVDGYGAESSLRKLLLGQRSLSAMWLALKRETLRTPLSVLRMHIRYAYRPAFEDRNSSIFGISPHEIGKGCLEGWGTGARPLLRPDQLVMREAVRRDLRLEEHFVNMMVWGYVDPVTFMNIKISSEEMVLEGEEEWAQNDGVEATELEDTMI
ncbi:MAG: Histone acetyltransferase type B subunit 2 [Chaenotheca gracillima]|nr:MAG: Histone acetyltransferase type B subunit 2 [Chaenotheca gracillima]